MRWCALLFVLLAPLLYSLDTPPPVAPTEEGEPKDEAEENFTINLSHPTFVRGVISTEQGGLILGDHFRLQAKKIAYTRKMEQGVFVQKVVAEGDLMLEYGDHIFVGRKLEYDLTSKTGTLWDGRTFMDIWYIGGEQVELKADQSFVVYGAWITTCESQEPAWDIKARSVDISSQHLLSAKNIRFRFFKMPVLWLPSFKTNLSWFKDPPIKYRLVWDKGIGPRATMRYQVFSTAYTDLFFRLDYRLKKGLGAALESEYASEDKRTQLVTRSYGAYDREIPQEHGPRRYRLQGLYHTENSDASTRVHMTYDKFSDIKMPSDFKSSDFVVDTQKRTWFFVDHRHEQFVTRLTVQPRINYFQSINQQLPNVTFGLHPFEVGCSRIISENEFQAGYLNYVFARQLKEILGPTSAGRFEARHRLYRPFSLQEIHFLPYVGATGIFYTNNPEQHAIGQGILLYGMESTTRLMRSYGPVRHLFIPYCNFEGYSAPTAPTDDHFIFGIEDGYSYLNLLRVGTRHLFYPRCGAHPHVNADLYTYAFLNENRSLHQALPKLYATCGWNQPSWLLEGLVAWNQAERVWDTLNARTLWTINASLAFGIEMRHRSRFDWRKSDHTNFFLDAARPLDNLLASPLSDGRNTFLSRLYMRFSPTLTCHLETQHSWGRRSEPANHAVDINFYKMLTASWLVKMGYQFSPKEGRFTYGVSLVN